MVSLPSGQTVSREIESLSKCNFSTFANEHGVTLSLVDLAIVNFDQTKHFVSFKPESFDSLSNENTFYLKQYTALNIFTTHQIPRKSLIGNISTTFERLTFLYVYKIYNITT